MKTTIIYNAFDLLQYLLRKYEIPSIKIIDEKIHIRHRFDENYDIYIGLKKDSYYLYDVKYIDFDSIEDLEEYLLKRVFITIKKERQLVLDL